MKYAMNNAYCRCIHGTVPAKLKVSSGARTVTFEDDTYGTLSAKGTYAAANIEDTQFTGDFGLCDSPRHIARRPDGQRVPCTPFPLGTWVPGAPDVEIGKAPALLASDHLGCIFASVPLPISIAHTVQSSVDHGAAFLPALGMVAVAGAELGPADLLLIGGAAIGLGAAALIGAGAAPEVELDVLYPGPKGPSVDPAQGERRKGGGKNAKHANQGAREAARKKYEQARKEYDEADRKPNKTPEDKAERDRLRKKRDKLKGEMEKTGDHDSQTPKGNQGR